MASSVEHVPVLRPQGFAAPAVPAIQASPRGGVPLPAALVRLLGAVAVAASDASDPMEMVRWALEHTRAVMGWTVGHAYRIDAEDRLADTDTWVGAPARAGAAGPGWSAVRDAGDSAAAAGGADLPGRVLATAGPVWIPDLAADPVLARGQLAADVGLRSAAGFPVIAAQRVVAVLEFFGTAPRVPDPLLEEVFVALGHEIGRVFERSAAVEATRTARIEAQQILDNAGDAYVAIDGDGIVIGWNKEAERMYGYPAAEAMGRSMADLIMPEQYRDAHDEGIARFKRNGHGRIAGQYVELEARRAGGEVFPIEMAFWGMRRGDHWQFYSLARDISERKQREEELAHWAVHDELTGLPNRAAAMQRLTQVLQRSRRTGSRTAAMFVDLDRFKVVNESLGHAVGDLLLQEVARRIGSVLWEEDLVARIGDDEFLVICPDVPDETRAVQIARMILQSLHRPVELPDDHIGLSASVGVVLSGSETETADDLLRDASAGISTGRDRVRGSIRVFDHGMRNRIRQRLQLERDLGSCVDNDELRLYYQPIVDMPSKRIIGFEALVRWQHPERGLIGPVEFIDLAEETGHIVPIGAWVLHEACRQARRWQLQGHHGFSVGVNLSARQFSQLGLVDDVRDTIAATGIDLTATRLVLEVTETMLMHDPDATAATLTQLRDLGVGLAIDDFGTGYSSLAYLKSFPVHTVKIDRSFVMNLGADSDDSAIVTAVTQLGHALDLTVLAEGVETAEQWAQVGQMGCDLAQGFLFGRPMPAVDATGLLVSRQV